MLSLRDTDADDVADTAKVVATGWGYTDDYHDWTTGFAEDSQHRFYIGLGSDYAHKNRPANESKWRGHILRFDLKGHIEDVASELRYPVGLTMTDDDKLFVSDQQGVQNCFNELNCIQMGHRYGVPAKNDPKTEAPADVAAVQVPHPWTRSVNGIAFWPRWTGHPFAGQIVGAEFNQRATGAVLAAGCGRPDAGGRVSAFEIHRRHRAGNISGADCRGVRTGGHCTSAACMTAAGWAA